MLDLQNNMCRVVVVAVVDPSAARVQLTMGRSMSMWIFLGPSLTERTTSTPSPDRLEETCSVRAPSGSVYLHHKTKEYHKQSYSKLDAQEHLKKKTVIGVIKENIKLNPILPFNCCQYLSILDLCIMCSSGIYV